MLVKISMLWKIGWKKIIKSITLCIFKCQHLFSKTTIVVLSQRHFDFDCLCTVFQCTFLVTCFRFSPFFVKEKTKRNIQLCYKQFIQSCVLNWFYLQTVFHKSTLSLMFRRERKSIDGIVMQKEFSIKIKMQF